MSKPMDWSSDPVVILEKAVLPAMWLGHVILAAPTFNAQTDPNDRRFAAFDRAAEMLRWKGPRMLREAGVGITEEAEAAFAAAANEIDAVNASIRRHLRDIQGGQTKDQLLAHITGTLHPAIETAVDAYRAIFISFVLDRQSLHALQAGEALRGLDRISKQIFFISINASVEAARAGDAGRGFLQISTDIRALSKSAQNATRDLSHLVTENQRAV